MLDLRRFAGVWQSFRAEVRKRLRRQIATAGVSRATEVARKDCHTRSLRCNSGQPRSPGSATAVEKPGPPAAMFRYSGGFPLRPHCFWRRRTNNHTFGEGNLCQVALIRCVANEWIEREAAAQSRFSPYGNYLYYFCSMSCKQKFDQNRAIYATAVDVVCRREIVIGEAEESGLYEDRRPQPLLLLQRAVPGTLQARP